MGAIIAGGCLSGACGIIPKLWNSGSLVPGMRQVLYGGLSKSWLNASFFALEET